MQAFVYERATNPAGAVARGIRAKTARTISPAARHCSI